MAYSRIQGLFINFGLISVVLVGIGSALQVSVTPTDFTSTIHHHVNITCTTDKQTLLARKIIVIEIGKEGEKPLAVINDEQELTLGPTSTANMEAEGRIVKGSSLSYLTLKIDNPSLQDEGRYFCKTFVLDEEYEIQEDKVFVNLTTSNIDISKVVSYLLERTQKQEDKLKTQSDQIHAQQTELDMLKKADQKNKAEVNALQKTISVLNTTLTHQKPITGNLYDICMETVWKLNETIIQQASLDQNQDTLIRQQNASMAFYQQSMDSFIKTVRSTNNQSGRKGTPLYAFTARYKNGDKLQSGNCITFSNIITNVGNAYDKNTGTFTAPYNGIYVFYLVVTTITAGDYLDITINKNGVYQANMHIKDTNSDETGATSVVLDLKAGNTVCASTVTIQSTGSTINELSQFMGFLISLS